MKQEMTSADVAAITAELTSGKTTLIDAKIEKIYQPAEDEIRINLYVRGKGRENLIIESGKRLHMSKYLKESPKTAQGFPMLLRKYIMGGRITSIEQHEYDRIVKINIVRGGEESVLIAELFSKGNVILTDKEGKIILPLKPVTFKERRIRSGEIYELPGKQLNPMKTTIEEMKETFAASDRDAVRALAAQFNLGGLYSEEIFCRCGIDKTKPANELTNRDIQIIFETVNEMMTPVKCAQFHPRLILKEKAKKAGEKAEKSEEKAKSFPENEILTKQEAEKSSESTASAKNEMESPEKPAFVLPKGMEIADVVAIDLIQYKDLPFIEFETFSDALDEAFGKTALSAVQTKKEEIKQDKKLGIYERRLKQQTETIEKFDREIEKNTKTAETIYANYSFAESVLNVLNTARESGRSWDEIKKIIDHAKAKNANEAAKAILAVQPAEASVTVDLKDCKAVLDIRKTIPQNANVYYDQAKKFEKKKEGAQKALADTQLILEKKEKEKEKDKSKAPEFTLRRKKHWYDRFKWFISSDGFLVVGGRDSDTNEEIFKKYMEKRDLVFHTEHPGAPLTVIKTEGKDVPESTVKEAATFAVSHSSLWKGKSASGDCYMVKAEQVSKTPESGEYVSKGSFIIRGERRYFEDVTLELAVGLELKEETRVIGGPVSAVKNNGSYVFEIIPGKFNQNDLSKKVYRLYTDIIKDQKFLKQIASPDLIAMVMPPGESDIKTGPDGGKMKTEPDRE